MSDRQASQGHATDPFAFVLGFVRSGTTMLRAMLDSHSTLAVPPESYFVVSLLQSSARLETAAGLDWTTVLDASIGPLLPRLEPRPRGAYHATHR